MIDRNKLILARTLLKAGHVKQVLAVDENGKSCDPDAPEARSWCVLGALMATDETVGRDNVHSVVGTLLAAHLPLVPKIIAQPPMCKVVEWNNHSDVTQADVVALFDRAIDALPVG